MNNKEIVEKFLNTLGELYGKKHNLKITYTVKKKRRRRKKINKEE